MMASREDLLLLAFGRGHTTLIDCCAKHARASEPVDCKVDRRLNHHKLRRFGAVYGLGAGGSTQQSCY